MSLLVNYAKKPIHTFTYYSQGWGLTYNGQHLIINGGTVTLRGIDPETFKAEIILLLKDQDTPLSYLNELGFVDG